MTNQDQRDLAASQAGLPSETLQARNGIEDDKNHISILLYRIATLEAIVKAGDELCAIVQNSDPEATCDNVKIENAIAAYRQAKERVK